MMFSRMVLCDQRLKLWNTMPSAGRLACFPSGTMRMVSPATVTSPELGVSSKLMQRRKVDFPEPDEPRIDTTSPSCASSDMPLRTSTRPKLLCRLRTLSATGDGEVGAVVIG